MNIFNVEVWKPALAAAGVVPVRKAGERWKASRKDGFHVLRHTYASVILEAGESVVTLARWLGHSIPTITLDFYAHFMPEAGGKGRGAIDSLLSRRAWAVPAGQWARYVDSYEKRGAAYAAPLLGVPAQKSGYPP